MNRLNALMSYLRLYIISILNKNCRINYKPFFLISRKVYIEVSKKSELNIGRGVHIRDGVVLSVRNHALLKLSDGVFINRNTIITSRKSIIIENGVTLGPNVCIYDHDHDMHNRGGYFCNEIKIKKNAWIGAGTIILKGVEIGENAVIASGSVVTKNVPANTILLQKRNSEYKIINDAE